MAGHIMKPDSIIVEVVQHSQTNLVPLPVVRLRSVSTANIKNK